MCGGSRLFLCRNGLLGFSYNALRMLGRTFVHRTIGLVLAGFDFRKVLFYGGSLLVEIRLHRIIGSQHIHRVSLLGCRCLFLLQLSRQGLMLGRQGLHRLLLAAVGSIDLLDLGHLVRILGA